MEMIKVVNNQNRYFNGARKGQSLTVPANMEDYYIKNGFAKLSDTGTVEAKLNIVVENPTITKAEIMKELDHLGVEYNSKDKKDILENLLLEAKKEKPATEENGDSGIKELKEQMLEEKIVEEVDLEGKTDEEILQLAKDNGLV